VFTTTIKDYSLSFDFSVQLSTRDLNYSSAAPFGNPRFSELPKIAALQKFRFHLWIPWGLDLEYRGAITPPVNGLWGG